MPPSALAQRDALLSALCGASWPFGVLYRALNLAPSADLLDIGAGDGALGREFRRLGHTGQVVGLDPQPSNSAVQAGRTEHLPYPDATFEVVVLLRVLAHLPDPAAALAEARRVLKSGGLLVVAAHGPKHLRAFWTALGQPLMPEQETHPADVRLSVAISATQAQALAQSYGLSFELPDDIFPLGDTLHLSIQTTKKP